MRGKEQRRVDGVRVEGGMVMVDGVKVARVRKVDDRACLEFLDRDRRRSAERGSREVCVPIDDLERVVRDAVEAENDQTS